MFEKIVSAWVRRLKACVAAKKQNEHVCDVSFSLGEKHILET